MIFINNEWRNMGLSCEGAVAKTGGGGGGGRKTKKKMGEKKIKDFVWNQIFTRGQKAFFSNFREKLFFFFWSELKVIFFDLRGSEL